MVYGDGKQSKSTTAVEVGTKMLQYVWPLGIYHIDVESKRSKHISVIECEMHFWWNGLTTSYIVGHVEYIGVWDIASAPPAFASIGY